MFYRSLRRLTEIDIPADTGDFRLMSRRTVEVFKAMPEEFRFIRGLIAWIGLSQAPIVHDRDPRYAGATVPAAQDGQLRGGCDHRIFGGPVAAGF